MKQTHSKFALPAVGWQRARRYIPLSFVAIVIIAGTFFVMNSLDSQPGAALPSKGNTSSQAQPTHDAMAQHPMLMPANNPSVTTATAASSRSQVGLAQVASSPSAADSDGSHPAAAIHGTTHRRVDPKAILGGDAHFSIGGCALGYGIAGQQCITPSNKATICQKSQAEFPNGIPVPRDNWLQLPLGKNNKACAACSS